MSQPPVRAASARGDAVEYSEDRCGESGIGWFGAYLAPLLFVVCVVIGGATDQILWAIPAVVFVIAWGGNTRLGPGVAYFRYRKVGMRLDAEGLRIGAVGRGAGSLGERQGKPLFQQRHAFSCPRDGIRSMRITTDRKEIKDLAWQSFHIAKKLSSGRVHLTEETIGVLVPPYAKAALVIEVDPDRAVIPEFRTVHGRGKHQDLPLQTPIPSSTWAVPTRKPERLRRLLTDAGYQTREAIG